MALSPSRAAAALAPGPGSVPGTLTVGALTLNSGSILNYQLATPGIIGGGVNSLTTVNGNLTLGGGTLNITGLSGFSSARMRSYQLHRLAHGQRVELWEPCPPDSPLHSSPFRPRFRIRSTWS